MVALAVAMLVLASCDTDNMYPTARASWTCAGGEPGAALFCQTDNSTFTYGLTSGTASDHATIVKVMGEDFAPTDLVVSRESPVVYTGSAETDVVFQVGAWVPSTAVGLTWCDNAVSSVRCDQHYARIRSGYVNRGVVCHEAGHSVGLVHGDSAEPPVGGQEPILECMRKAPGSLDRLGGHNRRMIDATY
ncbi:MAG: hypothetical protein KDB02_14295 [Acidimicrobiales bacterium]|nr:hypothetical protein [Actinomycetota bacterium]MCB0978618.1 hypothetical protein [Acidimicrobiales bacterium]